MDEGQRRTDEHITAWLSEMLGGDCGRAVADRWPVEARSVSAHRRPVHAAHGRSGAAGCAQDREGTGDQRAAYQKSWRRVVEWVHDDFSRMVLTAEQQFRRAAER